MVFKQSLKNLKIEKNNFIKEILKLEYLLYQNIYFLFHFIIYFLELFLLKKFQKVF